GAQGVRGCAPARQPGGARRLAGRGRRRRRPGIVVRGDHRLARQPAAARAASPGAVARDRLRTASGVLTIVTGLLAAWLAWRKLAPGGRASDRPLRGPATASVALRWRG